MNSVRADVAKLLTTEEMPCTNLENGRCKETPSFRTNDQEGISMEQTPTLLLYKDTPFLVRVLIPDLRIYSGPSSNFSKGKRNTGKGVFTIMEVKVGSGSTNGWGLLKAYSDKRNGWINLDHVTLR